MKDNKKPFGLALACNIAAQAIHENTTPTSVILSNLLVLQKDVTFPKALDTQYFTVNKKIPSETDKKTISKILNDLRSPHTGVSALLENNIKDGWVQKKAPPIAPVVQTKAPFKKKKKPVAKPLVAPVVTVKKNKLG